MAKRSISIPDELYERLVRLAGKKQQEAGRHVSVAELIRQAIVYWLEHTQK